jgi:hypothetical protein
MNIDHKHHIIPRHMGGTDDPSNLIELTIAEHAEAHRRLYEEHGRWQDKLAWQALSGQIDTAEITRQKCIEAGKARKGKPSGRKGKTASPETRLKMSIARTGKTKSIETREKLRKAKLGRGIPHTEETKRKISEAQKKRHSLKS